MVDIKSILAKGYFPKELPPPFVTTDLANQYSSLPVTKARPSVCLRCSYSKYATVRRAIAIPNPAHFVPLAKAVTDNWGAIDKHCRKSTISRTRPEAGKERAVTGVHNLEELPSARAEIRTGAQYVVKADVENFYGSLYTHAIPWAFHTKTVAKADQGHTKSAKGGAPLYGNVIDFASRNVQSGQTIGVPVGPDTSFIIAESVLCAADDIIQPELPRGVLGFRFSDDYEFACKSPSEAAEVLTVVQDALAEFELQVNPRKTSIVELPDILDTAWSHELAAFDLKATNPSVLNSQLLRYFSRAFVLVREYPGEPVLKYAVSRVSRLAPTSSSAEILIQRLVLQAAAVDPGTLHTALYILFNQRLTHPSIVDMSTLGRVLESIIQRHAPLQHGIDVAWALWGAIVFKVVLDDATVGSLERLTDPVAVLMALYAEEHGRLARKLTCSQWETQTTRKDLFESKWLLVYEGVGKGWLKPKAGDPAPSEPFFAAMRTKGISFLDTKAKQVIPEPSPAGVSSG